MNSNVFNINNQIKKWIGKANKNYNKIPNSKIGWENKREKQ